MLGYDAPASNMAGQGLPPSLSVLGSGALQDETQWSVGIGLTFPLFEGGAKSATELRTSETLRQLKFDHQAPLLSSEEHFQTIEEGLDDPHLLTSEKRLFAYVDNPHNFQLFREFQVQEGVKASPELGQLVAAIAAQERLVLNNQRSYWMPDVGLDLIHRCLILKLQLP